MSHKNNFNFLRIFAALLVAVTHSYAITGYALQEPFYKLTNAHFYFSSIGLYIFFFTSGYLVSRSATDSSTSLIYVRKRILRIYPALICVVLLSVFIAGPLLTSKTFTNYFTDVDTWQYLWTATGIKIRFMLPGVFENNKFFMSGFNGSLWSIRLELEMYALLFIFLITKIFSNQKLFIAVSSIIIFLLLIFNARSQYSLLISDHKNSLLACTFLFGGIVQTKVLSEKILWIFLIISMVFLILKVTGFITFDIMLDEVIFFSIITYFIAFNKRFIIDLRTDISYGIYIYTFPLQQLFFQLAGFKQATAINLLLSLCTSCLFAFTSWLFIEKPAMKYKYKLR